MSEKKESALDELTALSYKLTEIIDRSHQCAHNGGISQTHFEMLSLDLRDASDKAQRICNLLNGLRGK